MSQIQESKIAEAKSNILYCDDKEGDRDREREREREGVIGGTSSTSYRNYNGDTVTHTQSSSNVGRLCYSNVLMSLRRLCNHPYLLLEDVKSIPDELYYKDLVASSGKLSLLHGLLKHLIPRGHKVSHNTSNHCYRLLTFTFICPLIATQCSSYCFTSIYFILFCFVLL
jgi:SNF2 family DNA or RNA helicase